MRRTASALLLTAAAVAVPCGAWYVTGRRDVSRQEERLLERPKSEGRETALRLAERIAARLEALREAESRRPFYHYQSLYHEPRGAHEGFSVIPSPLADGPDDPLVRAHFQIDAAGKLSLPTLNEEVCDLNSPDRFVTQEPLLAELSTAARVWWQSMRERQAGPPRAPFRTKTMLAYAPASIPAGKVELLESAAWAQNVQASKLYVDIKSRRDKTSPVEIANPGPDGGAEAVMIQVGDMQWSTVDVGSAPALVALREVVTPAGAFMQGFQVSSESVRALLSDAPLPATLSPGAPNTPEEVLVALPASPWHLAVDVSSMIDAARIEARRLRSRFLRSFVAGSLLAVLAGAFVVGLVFQSERLAVDRSRFAAAAAHELRTPLAGLRMYGEMISEGLGDPTRSRDYARRVADEAERLGRVVGNVLEITRLERGTLTVRPRAGDLGAAVRSCVERLRAPFLSAGAPLVLRVSEELPAASFDADALDQILQNLLDNAEKFARDAADRTIEVAVEPVSGSARLSVSDRGPGITPGARRKLFRTFSRSADASGPSGLGLGLVLVKALAEAGGARAVYEDRPGGGAVFSVLFPACPTSP